MVQHHTNAFVINKDDKYYISSIQITKVTSLYQTLFNI